MIGWTTIVMRLARMFAGVIYYLYVAGRPVPADLVNVLLIIIGFTFGERVGGARQAGYREAERVKGEKR